MPLPSSLTLTKEKEVWERLADGVGMGRRRWVFAGTAGVGLDGEVEVLLSEGREEGQGMAGGLGGCSRMGVET